MPEHPPSSKDERMQKMGGVTLATVIIVGTGIGLVFAWTCAERRRGAVPFYVLFFTGIIGAIVALTIHIAA